MVVNVLVNIEGSKGIECATKVDFSWNGYIASEDWEKVSSTDYGIHMYNGHDPIPITVKIRFDDPHAVVRVRIVEWFVKFVDECT